MRSGIGNSASDPVYVSSVADPANGVQGTGTTGNPTITASSAGTSVSRLVSSAASVNTTSIKAAPGTVYLVDGYNSNAAARYLKLYNKASAPTVGTDTPFLTKYLAPQSAFSIPVPAGLQFSAGIAYALTTAAADNDTGALTAGDVMAMNVVYR